MLLTWTVTIPAGTSDSAPYTQRLDLIAGIVTKIEIRFLAGCHGLVKIRFSKAGTPIVPSNANAYIIGDDEVVQIDTLIPFISGTMNLTLEGSSPDTTYEHKITIRITIDDEQELDSILSYIQEIKEMLTSPDSTEA